MHLQAGQCGNQIGAKVGHSGLGKYVGSAGSRTPESFFVCFCFPASVFDETLTGLARGGQGRPCSVVQMSLTLLVLG